MYSIYLLYINLNFLIQIANSDCTYLRFWLGYRRSFTLLSKAHLEYIKNSWAIGSLLYQFCRSYFQVIIFLKAFSKFHSISETKRHKNRVQQILEADMLDIFSKIT